MKIKHFVRQSLFCGILLCAFSGMGRLEVHAELLPDIDADQFTIVPTQMSRSGRIYRFTVKSGEAPRTGRIILIQHHKKPIMAFRVLKSDEESHEIIVKRVRRYDTEGNLKLEEVYESAEKIADLIDAPIPETRFDPNAKPEMDPFNGGKYLNPPSKETEFKLDPNAPPLMGDGGKQGMVTEGSPPASRDLEHFDNDLDSGTSPQEEHRDRSPNSKTDSEVEEFKVLNPFKHMVGVSVGNFRNLSGFSIPGTTHNGFGASYSQVTKRGIWNNSRKVQDTLSMEFGLEYYSRANFTGNNDSYEVLPIKAEGLYSLYFSESAAFLAYFGLQYNWIFSTNNYSPNLFPTEKDAYNAISGIQPNLGVGFLYNIGPQWYLRADLGIDRIALGLAVKW